LSGQARELVMTTVDRRHPVGLDTVSTTPTRGRSLAVNEKGGSFLTTCYQNFRLGERDKTLYLQDHPKLAN
jgi:hypothetical protein